MGSPLVVSPVGISYAKEGVGSSVEDRPPPAVTASLGPVAGGYQLPWGPCLPGGQVPTWFPVCWEFSPNTGPSAPPTP